MIRPLPLFFSKCQDRIKSKQELNKDLTVISSWAFQWKMDVNSDPRKQVIEICFSRKIVTKNSKVPSFN